VREAIVEQTIVGTDTANGVTLRDAPLRSMSLCWKSRPRLRPLRPQVATSFDLLSYVLPW
jgi:hypothetical protein